MSDAAPPADTNDLRHGPDLHPALLTLLPLVGVWRGVGRGGYPTMDDFDFGQQVSFSHDGRDFLRYESASWLLAPDGGVGEPSERELGWWRAGAAEDFEALISHSTGVSEVYVGHANSTTQWELVTDVVARTASAPAMSAAKRLYGIVDRALLYAADVASSGHPLHAHVSARLERIAG